MSQHPNQTTRRPAADPRPTRKDGKPWLWALVGIAVLVGLFAFGAAAQSFSSLPEKADATKAAAEPAKTTTPPKATATTKPAEAGPKIGSTVRDGQFAFAVTAVSCGKTTIGSSVVHLTADGKYCIVTVRVDNVGSQSRIFTDKSQKAYDADGTKFSADTEAGFYANNADQTLLKKINPGDRVTEKLVFDVPKSISLATLELHDSPFSGGVKVSLTK